MANQTNSLAHTKWVCKYHVVFTPKNRSGLQEIIRTLCRYKGVENIEGKTQENMQRHLAQEIAVEEMAPLCGRIVTHFRRLFRAVYGLAPIQYLRRLRVERAEEIGAATGFESGNDFIRCFKQYTGQTSMQYRREDIGS